MASLSSLAGRNPTFRLALIWMLSPVAGLRPMRASRVLTARMPSPLMRTRAPCFRCVVTVATKSASRVWACFFCRACASPSCSNTAFNVTTGAAAALGLGAGATDFDLAAAGVGCLAVAFLAGAFLLAAGRVAMAINSLVVVGPTQSRESAGREGGAFAAARPVEHHRTPVLDIHRSADSALALIEEWPDRIQRGVLHDQDRANL